MREKKNAENEDFSFYDQWFETKIRNWNFMTKKNRQRWHKRDVWGKIYWNWFEVGRNLLEMINARANLLGVKNINIEMILWTIWVNFPLKNPQCNINWQNFHLPIFFSKTQWNFSYYLFKIILATFFCKYYQKT